MLSNYYINIGGRYLKSYNRQKALNNFLKGIIKGLPYFNFKALGGLLFSLMPLKILKSLLIIYYKAL